MMLDRCAMHDDFKPARAARASLLFVRLSVVGLVALTALAQSNMPTPSSSEPAALMRTLSRGL